jgi:hypothetical protein
MSQFSAKDFTISKIITKNQEEMSMKKVLTVCLTMVFVLTVALSAFAEWLDRDAIKKRVDEIVTAIDNGKAAADFKSAAKEKPYVYIIKTDGTVLFYNWIAEGQNIKTANELLYKAVNKADANGTWVRYEPYPGWNEDVYVRKTKDGLFFVAATGYNNP